MPEAIPGLDGASRQAKAASLWQAWRSDGCSASILIGFSGVGKTERVVAPLADRARNENVAAVIIDVPQSPTDLDLELKAALVEALREAGLAEVAIGVGREPNLAQALRLVLRLPALVVIDEFQRLLAPNRPIPVMPFADQLAKIARRPGDGGCLWLVSNREVDPEWSEPFHVELLDAPSDTVDVVHIVLNAIGTDDVAERFPAGRHEEVARRFGRNPRALRLLGNMLRFHELTELIGEPRHAEAGVSQNELAERIERSLLVKAREGLSNSAAHFLRDLSVLRDPAPLGLIEAMAQHLGDAGTLCHALQERFLLAQKGGLRQVHPLVREIEAPRLDDNPEAAHAAHRRAGSWYAGRLASAAVPPVDDTRLTLLLASATYHLRAAAAVEDLRAALQTVRPYLERRFSWAVRPPSTAAERDAQIGLLQAFLELPGAPSVEYQFARLLKARGIGDDRVLALRHAERATAGQDSSPPWVLYCQLDYLVNGAEHAIGVARAAVAAVDPAKNLVSVYQLLSAALSHVGRDSEAVSACLEGVERSPRSNNNIARLVEAALQVAAAMPTDEQLRTVRDWAINGEQFEPQVALAEILTDERRGDWREGAQRARIARRRHPRYLHLCLYEAFCWLAANEPEEAQQALDALPQGLRFNERESSTWLAAFVALRTDDVARAGGIATIYIGAAARSSPSEIEAMLLHEWDHRVATPGEANPALIFPILPPALSGLPEAVIRPQHGPPVLPQHQAGSSGAGGTIPPLPQPTGPSRPRVLAVATEWSSGHGGLSTLNRQLCIALAQAGLEVDCYVIEASADEISAAKREHNVNLLLPPPTPSFSGMGLLLTRPAGLSDGYSPEIIIGHGRITGAAALSLQRDHFPADRRLHFVHMAPDEIERFKTERDEDPWTRAEQRSGFEWDLARDAEKVVAIGPRLQGRYEGRYESDLVPRGLPVPLRFDPGFDAEDMGPRSAPGGSLLRVLVLGRAEDSRLKGLDIAATALGRLATERVEAGQRSPRLELVVRGAKPEQSVQLDQELRAAAGTGQLEFTVRNYTTSPTRLNDDIAASTLILMPSRAEGFGLVGLEAIISATPVLVSSRSGLAELLEEALDTDSYRRVVVEMSQNDAEDIARWKSAIEGAIRDRDASFRRAYELQRLLAEQLPWAQSVANLLNALGIGPMAAP